MFAPLAEHGARAWYLIHDVGRRHGAWDRDADAFPAISGVALGSSGALFAFLCSMSHHKLFYEDAKHVRDTLNEAVAIAREIHRLEQTLIEKLHYIDRKKYYVRYEFRSLSGFARDCLKFSRTQAQRIVTLVRRYLPTANIVD